MKNKREDICETFCFDEKRVNKVKKSLPSKIESIKISQKLKLLSDPTRLRIIFALFKASELCVCDLATALDMKDSAISHQLRLFRAHGLVEYRKEGKLVFYSLTKDKSLSIIKKNFLEIS